MNEAMAAYFEIYLVHLTYPKLRLHEHFNIRKMHSAFKRDSLLSTTPATDPSLKMPSEVNNKIASVIRMFEHAIGTDLYRAALNRYLLDKYVPYDNS